MELGLFPWICLVGWSVFLPGSVWDRLEKAIPLRSKSNVTTALGQRLASASEISNPSGDQYPGHCPGGIRTHL